MNVDSLIGSLAGKVVEKGGNAIGEKSSEWIGDAIGKMRAELPTGASTEMTAIRDSGTFALDKIEGKKDQLGRMAYQEAVAFFGLTATGKFSDASQVLLKAYGGGQGVWAEADATVAAAGDRTEQAKRDEQALVGLAKEIGSATAKIVLPLLMSIAPL